MRKSDKQLEAHYKQVANNIEYLRIIHDTPPERCGLAMGKSRSAYYRKMKNPGNFEICEIEGLARLWNVPARKIMYGCLSEEVSA